MQALGGAKNHMVVMPDADMDQAVDALIGSAFGSAGERCMAISVAVLVGDVGQRIMPALVQRTCAQRCCMAKTWPPRWGPSSPDAALERITGYIGAGMAEAQLLVDGRLCRPGAGAGCEGGFGWAARCLTMSSPPCAFTARRFLAPCSCVRVPDLAQAVELINAMSLATGELLYPRRQRGA